MIEAKRKAKQNDSFYVPAEPKLAFVVRIKGSVLANGQLPADRTC